MLAKNGGIMSCSNIFLPEKLKIQCQVLQVFFGGVGGRAGDEDEFRMKAISLFRGKPMFKLK